jgi:hypothetical protein
LINLQKPIENEWFARIKIVEETSEILERLTVVTLGGWLPIKAALNRSEWKREFTAKACANGANKDVELGCSRALGHSSLVIHCSDHHRPADPLI